MSMDNMNEKFWNDVAPGLQRALNLRPLTQSQAERAYSEASEVPIRDEEIEALLQAARLDVPREPSFDTDAPPIDEDSLVAPEVCEIYRNEGDADDPVIEEQLDKQRREALEDDEESEDGDGSEAS